MSEDEFHQERDLHQEPDEDVEGHMNQGVNQGVNQRQDDDEDDVEGHMNQGVNQGMNQ